MPLEDPEQLSQPRPHPARPWSARSAAPETGRDLPETQLVRDKAGRGLGHPESPLGAIHTAAIPTTPTSCPSA